MRLLKLIRHPWLWAPVTSHHPLLEHKSNTNAAATTTSAAPSSASKALTDEEKIDMINILRPEVICRLRMLKQSITLFGEDDDARLERLKHVLKTGMFEVDSDMTEGQTNDFLRDIAELRKRQKSGIVSDRKRKNSEVVDLGVPRRAPDR